jgi:signal peptidase I
MGRNLTFTLLRALVLAIAAFLVFRFILIPVRVTGRSMEPTCHNGQIGLLNVFAYKHSAPQRGDLVGFYDTDGSLVIKRVIALPNEQMAFDHGQLLINGHVQDEPYLHFRPRWDSSAYQTNAYFVIGDNRFVTRWFYIQGSQVLGRFLIKQH